MAEPSEAEERAAALHEEGMARSEAGDDDGALELYLQALALDCARPDTLYNVGLVCKYRRDWEKSPRYDLMEHWAAADPARRVISVDCED